MRRRRKRKSRVILIFSSLIAVTAAGIGYKSIPGLAEAAGRLGEVKVGFESDPKNYTCLLYTSYLSKKAADKLSIRISAESTIGKGSIFYIDLHSDKLKIE